MSMIIPLRRPSVLVLACLLAVTAVAQPSRLSAAHPRHELPKYLAEALSAPDRDLFTRLLNINIEAAWGYLRTRGYPYSFTNEVGPVAAHMRLVGRARTGRYLPFRQDLADAYKEHQLNYRSAEDTNPGDVIVFDTGGEMESSPSGDITSLRAVVLGCAGIIVEGVMRDTSAFIEMGLPLFTRDGKGHAAGVKPGLSSWDYQIPVRVGKVTIVPGDYIVGAPHGILVIPAAMVNEVLEHAEQHARMEEFQRSLLLEGHSMIGIYPPNEKTREAFEMYLNKVSK